MKPSCEIPLVKTEKVCWIIAGIGLLICIWGFFAAHRAFAFSYLLSFLFWSGVLLGALPVIMIHNLTGGNWGYPIRRILETMTGLIPWLLLFFVPLAFSVEHLYIWMDPEAVAHDALLQDKAFYLNAPFFVIRTLFYFLIWILLGFFATKDFRIGSKQISWRGQASGIGLGLYALTITFSSLDWAMSLEPHWNSTIYGLIFMIGQTLLGFSFVTFLALLFSRYEPFNQILTSERSRDLGTLLFVFVMLWAYVSLSQFIIIWSGNLPETTPWYIARCENGWQMIAIFIMVFHFAVPFFLLLIRSVKKNRKILIWIVAWILIMRWFDLFWYVRPVSSPELSFTLLDLGAMMAIGGWITAMVINRLKQTSLGVEEDPLFRAYQSKVRG